MNNHKYYSFFFKQIHFPFQNNDHAISWSLCHDAARRLRLYPVFITSISTCWAPSNNLFLPYVGEAKEKSTCLHRRKTKDLIKDIGEDWSISQYGNCKAEKDGGLENYREPDSDRVTKRRETGRVSTDSSYCSVITTSSASTCQLHSELAVRMRPCLIPSWKTDKSKRHDCRLPFRLPVLE